MARGEEEAINRVVPDPAGSGSDTATQNTAFTAGASTASIAIPKAPAAGQGGVAGRWITLRPLSGNCAIAFGFASTMGAATANDKQFVVNEQDDWFVPYRYSHMRVWGIGSGTLQWHISS